VEVTRLGLRDFRSYERAELVPGAGLTVVTGANGAGKTNLLEALYFGCTGRSCRTANEREAIRFGARVAHLELEARDGASRHELSAGFGALDDSGRLSKRLRADDVTVERLTEATGRPLVSVFMPDRLELVAGTPSLRRAHLDQVVAALWPTRAATRRAYAQALAQRNALLARMRAGRDGGSLASWDTQLARHGIELMDDRAQAVGALAPRFERHAAALGLDQSPAIAYRPRSPAATAQELAAELAERVTSDLERGFTGHGPHRDELVFSRDGRELRAYGSRGQQRLALLALLLAEREQLAETRGAPPLMLLDDPMSELDAARRERLSAVLRAGGQSVVTATDTSQVPGAQDAEVTRLAVTEGTVLQELSEVSRRRAG